MSLRLSLRLLPILNPASRRKHTVLVVGGSTRWVRVSRAGAWFLYEGSQSEATGGH